MAWDHARAQRALPRRGRRRADRGGRSGRDGPARRGGNVLGRLLGRVRRSGRPRVGGRPQPALGDRRRRLGEARAAGGGRGRKDWIWVLEADGDVFGYVHTFRRTEPTSGRVRLDGSPPSRTGRTRRARTRAPLRSGALGAANVGGPRIPTARRTSSGRRRPLRPGTSRSGRPRAARSSRGRGTPPRPPGTPRS